MPDDASIIGVIRCAGHWLGSRCRYAITAANPPEAGISRRCTGDARVRDPKTELVLQSRRQESESVPMSHMQRKPPSEMPGRTCSWSRLRRAAILGSAFICLAAVGMRSDLGPRGDGPGSPWVTNWLAPVHGTARLMHALESVESMSDAAIDAASLLVLGLSLVGGGRIIRRLRLRATEQPWTAVGEKPSRSPVASMHVGPRRIAR